VIDAASVDGRRRLLLVRRDNVEHLVMIGGPTDIVIEQNIVRAVPVAPPSQRQQADPALRQPPEQLMARGAADPYRERTAAEPRPRLEPLPRRPEPARAPQPTQPPRSLRAQPPSRRMDEGPTEVHAAPPTADAGLADMATKLEAALRRPPQVARPEPEPGPVLHGPTPPTVPAPEPAGPPKPPPAASAEPPAPPAAAPAASTEKPAETNGNAKAPAPSKSVFDSLEEEMASLLGRPPEKK
jgi:hypothetical protein